MQSRVCVVSKNLSEQRRNSQNHASTEQSKMMVFAVANPALELVLPQHLYQCVGAPKTPSRAFPYDRFQGLGNNDTSTVPKHTLIPLLQTCRENNKIHSRDSRAYFPKDNSMKYK